MNIIIEGLTGAGKSKIINCLKNLTGQNNLNVKIIYESDTFGELLDEISKKKPENENLFRIHNCLKQIKENTDKSFILERFHFSYYPFLSNWELYSEIDQNLNNLNFFLILLTYREELLFSRALNHYDIINSTGTEAVINYFGSTEKALEAYRNSQAKRIECLKYTKLPFMEIDTSEMEWEKYASQIIKIIKRP